MLQGRQAAVQVGGPQVEEADHQRQGQQRPLSVSRHGGLQEEGVAVTSGAPAGGRRGQAAQRHLPPRQGTPTPVPKFNPHRKGVGTQVSERKETEKRKIKDQKTGDAPGGEGAGAPSLVRQGSEPGPSALCSHLGHELREGVHGDGAAQRGRQAQQPHEPQRGHLPQPPARAPGALPQLPLGQQLLGAAATRHEARGRHAHRDRGVASLPPPMPPPVPPRSSGALSPGGPCPPGLVAPLPWGSCCILRPAPTSHPPQPRLPSHPVTCPRQGWPQLTRRPEECRAPGHPRELPEAQRPPSQVKAGGSPDANPTRPSSAVKPGPNLCSGFAQGQRRKRTGLARPGLLWRAGIAAAGAPGPLPQ